VSVQSDTRRLNPQTSQNDDERRMITVQLGERGSLRDYYVQRCQDRDGIHITTTSTDAAEELLEGVEGQ